MDAPKIHNNRFYSKCSDCHVHFIKNEFVPDDRVFMCTPQSAELDIIIERKDQKLFPFIGFNYECPIRHRINVQVESLSFSEALKKAAFEFLLNKVRLYVNEFLTLTFGCDYLLDEFKPTTFDRSLIRSFSTFVPNELLIIPNMDEFISCAFNDLPISIRPENPEAPERSSISNSNSESSSIENQLKSSLKKSKSKTDDDVQFGKKKPAAKTPAVDSNVKKNVSFGANMNLSLNSGASTSKQSLASPDTSVPNAKKSATIPEIIEPRFKPIPANAIQVAPEYLIDEDRIPINRIHAFIPYHYEGEPLRINFDCPVSAFQNLYIEIWRGLNRGIYQQFQIIEPMIESYNRRQTYEIPRIETEANAWKNHLNLVRNTFENDSHNARYLYGPIWTYISLRDALAWPFTILGKVRNQSIEVIYDSRLQHSLVSNSVVSYLAWSNPGLIAKQALEAETVIYIPWRDDFRVKSNFSVYFPITLNPGMPGYENDEHIVNCYVTELHPYRISGEVKGTIILGRNFTSNIIKYDDNKVEFTLKGTRTNPTPRIVRCKKMLPLIRVDGILNTLRIMSPDQLRAEFEHILLYIRAKKTKDGVDDGRYDGK
ncbi:uncharacterized protein LOC135846523 [Planococcus citri]|uniref:uncharacterized protein LOC135846523 n=1 Tax=Planococcus citri TaxID=170843 RepID=UPI0031FA0BAE